jgi:preprotein translocase subunit SecA
MVVDLMEEVALSTIDVYANRAVRPEDWDLEGLELALKEIFHVDFELQGNTGRDPIERTVWDTIWERFQTQEQMVKDVAGKINDARRAEREALEANGEDETGGDWAGDDLEEVTWEEIFREQVQTQYLRSIDRFWRQHLQAMEQLRDGIGMRGYAQKDPKQEYKKEGYNLFLDLLMNIKTSVVRFVSTFQIEEPASVRQQQQPQVPKQIFLNRDAESGGEEEDQETFRRELPKVGRNDPCPCGSGKKYKHCHGRRGAPDLPPESRTG